MCRIGWLFWVLIVLAAFSPAQVTPPPCWTVQNTGGAAILFSPGEPSSRVAITLLPPGSPIGNVKSWFGDQALALAQASGRTLGATEVTEQEGILLRVVQVENQNHMKLRMVFYGYPSARGFSIPILMIPPRVGDEDPRLETANYYVQQLAVQKFELSAAPAAATQPEQPATGWRPKTDIDLTYHAKAIIPKERDVPLKGVYVFIGYAFAPRTEASAPP